MALKNSGSDFARSLRSDHATPSGALRKARPGPPPSLDDNSPVQHAGRDETGDQGRSSLHTPAAGPGKPPARPRPSSAVAAPPTRASSAKTPAASGLRPVLKLPMASPNSPDLSDRLAGESSEAFDDGAEELSYESGEGESVQVMVRVRPSNPNELAATGHNECLNILGTRQIKLALPHRPDAYSFVFDNVFSEASPQEEVFEYAGVPVVDNCMCGYNSSIFCYGQTGSGKTHTMLGRLASKPAAEEPEPLRGLAPRAFEYLFQRIAEEEAKKQENVTYCCRCSMIEIYNECITDLLNPAATNLQVREDIRHGCFVEHLTEVTVNNVTEVLALMKKGADNRHVGATRLNHESSRSHSVFTCVVERVQRESADSPTQVIFSRLNLVDLAGSERIQTGAHGGSQATGEHFKEACHINKSLTTLGRVIMELVESQRQGRPRHVPYRDSKLTFLLHDSLGGNAKTMIIANVSPSSVCGAETLSTLQFAKRAKFIRNKAVVNLDCRGDVMVLQKEIMRLNAELDDLRSGQTDTIMRESEELRRQLAAAELDKQETGLKLEVLASENARFRRERGRLEEKMLALQTNQGDMGDFVSALVARLDALQAASDTAAKVSEERLDVLSALLDAAVLREAAAAELAEAAQAEVARQRENFEAQREARRAAEAQAEKLLSQVEVDERGLKLAQESILRLEGEAAKQAAALAAAQEQLAVVSADKERTETSLASASRALEEKAAACEQLQKQAEQQAAELAKQAEGAESTAAELNAQLGELRDALEAERAGRAAEAKRAQGVEEKLSHVSEALAAAEELIQAEQASASSSLQVKEEELEAARSELADAARELEQRRESEKQLQQQMEASQVALSASQEQGARLQQQLAEQKAAFDQMVETSESGAAQLREQLHAERVAAQAAADASAAAQGDLAARLSEVEAKLVAEQEAHASTRASLEQQGRRAEAEVAQLGASLQAEQAALAAAREEVSGLAHQVEVLTAQLEGQQSSNVGAQQQIGQLNQKLAHAEADLAAEREQHKEVAAKLEETEAQLAAAQAALQGAQSEKTALAASDEARAAEVASLQQQLEASATEAARLRASGSSLASELEAQRTEAAQLRDKLYAEQATAERQRQEAEQAMTTVLAVKAAAEQELRTDAEALRRRVSSGEHEAAALEASNNELRGQVTDLQKELIRHQEAAVAAEFELKQAARAQLAEKEREVAELRKQLADATDTRRRLDEIESQAKGYLMANTRQAKAFMEIRRLLDWAAAPAEGGADASLIMHSNPLQAVSAEGVVAAAAAAAAGGMRDPAGAVSPRVVSASTRVSADVDAEGGGRLMLSRQKLLRLSTALQDAKRLGRGRYDQTSSPTKKAHQTLSRSGSRDVVDDDEDDVEAELAAEAEAEMLAAQQQ